LSVIEPLLGIPWAVPPGEFEWGEASCRASSAMGRALVPR
jgi:hypothetical protein